ncbi:MAG: hypothetical protein HYS22_00380 [Deltaproteobacteria bacterium]|nr:hypothetical protein [Deltaproteobacteria bacterium]
MSVPTLRASYNHPFFQSPPSFVTQGGPPLLTQADRLDTKYSPANGADHYSFHALLKGSLAQQVPDPKRQEQALEAPETWEQTSEYASEALHDRNPWLAWRIIFMSSQSDSVKSAWRQQIQCSLVCNGEVEEARQMAPKSSNGERIEVSLAQCEEQFGTCETARDNLSKSLVIDDMRDVNILINKGDYQGALALADLYGRPQYRLAEIKHLLIVQGQHERKQQAESNRAREEQSRQAALKRKQDARAQEAERKRAEREERARAAEEAREKAIKADGERKEAFIRSLASLGSPNFEEAERLRKTGGWSQEVIRSLVNRALEKTTTFPIDNCDKAKLIRNEYKWVGGLCTPERTSITDKGDGSCKLDCP